MIYVLLLQENKIYVGYSSRPIGSRFLEHFNHNGSQWTTKYKPVEVLSVYPLDKESENEITLQMMEKYGWWNVRGGSWCQVELSRCPAALLERKGLKMPEKLKNHWNKEVINVEVKKLECFRCGRERHFASDCKVEIHVDGSYIIDDSSDSSLDDSDVDTNSYSSETCSESERSSFNACFKCGREGHWAQNCFAKTRIDGTPINNSVIRSYGSSLLKSNSPCFKCGLTGHWARDCHN